MSRAKGRSRGFTLIAALLVLALLSAIAVSLLFMVQGAGQVGGNDLETNRAYYGAESGMELLTANLAALYQQSQSPTPAQITNLTNSPPDSTMINGMNYQESITWTPDANGNPASRNGVISAGSNAGLTAEIIPLTLKVAATRPGGASVNMTRGVEVALIPVFQFGVFSDSDLSYFAGPPFGFQGRVHTNGNLFLAANNGPLIIDAKVTAVGEIIRDRLANNYNSAGAYQGDVYVPDQTGGCDPPNATANAHCLKFTLGDGSWQGGIPPAAGGNNLDRRPGRIYRPRLSRVSSVTILPWQCNRSTCRSCKVRRERRSRSQSYASLPWVNLRPRQREPRVNSIKPTFVFYWPAPRPIWFPTGRHWWAM